MKVEVLDWLTAWSLGKITRLSAFQRSLKPGYQTRKLDTSVAWTDPKGLEVPLWTTGIKKMLKGWICWFWCQWLMGTERYALRKKIFHRYMFCLPPIFLFARVTSILKDVTYTESESPLSHHCPTVPQVSLSKSVSSGRRRHGILPP